MIRVGDIARIIEQNYPLHFALPGDNCGLQAGDPDRKTGAVLVALDPSPEAVRRALRVKAGLLVTHHPLFHDPVRRIDTSSLVGSAAAASLAGGVALYAAHTNLDAAPRGLAREMARLAGVKEAVFFGASGGQAWFKLVVFVPGEHADAVLRAMAAAGAGKIGRYESCAFMASGEGMFRPLAGSRPAVGRRGRLETVKERRLEMVVEKDRCPMIVKAMLKAHPYEEAAWDLYPLRRESGGGIGCAGTIEPLSFTALAERLSARFAAAARLSGRPPARIRRIACVPGSGGGYLAAAHREGAQALITGEARYHQMVEAEHLGMGMVELGHDRSELPAVDLLARVLRRGLPGGKKRVAVYTYRRPAAARNLPERQEKKREAK